MKNSAFVLAAGFGTRLQPLTLTTPKPLVPVCGVPMLAWSLALLRHHGITAAIVNTHYLAEAFHPWQGLHEGVFVTLSHETPDILGTGGGLRHVQPLLSDCFVIVNADILCDIDLTKLIGAVPTEGASMSLRRSPEVKTYGVVGMDKAGVVSQLAHVALAEPEGEVDVGTHFTGVHAMSQHALLRVPTGFHCVVRTAYKEMVPQRVVRGVEHDGVWLDVGNPAAYLDANIAVLNGHGPTHLDVMSRAGWSRDHLGVERGDAALVEGVVTEGPVWVGVGAKLPSGTRLTRTVIGAGSIVAPNTVLDACVVWDDERVGAGNHQRQIFHSGEQTQIA
jgi:mannose-1-phosphate guanylyltransferase